VKVLFVVHQFADEGHGGTERVVLALALGLQGLGHEVVVACGSLERDECDRLDERRVRGLRVVHLHRDDLYFESWYKAWSPGVSRAFSRLLEREKPDVVHVHHWFRMTTDFARRARAHGAVAAVTLHDYFAVLARVTRLWGEDDASPPAASGLVSRAEAAEAFEFHRRDLAAEVRAAHLRYAPSRAHAAGLAALAPCELGAFAVARPQSPLPGRAARPAARGRRLVHWGALYEHKGLETALLALRIAKERGQAWSLDVFGEASSPEYEARVRELARGLEVSFHGAFTHEDLENVQADLAVFPALSHESYGVVLDEARALGWPVLASALPAFCERLTPAAGRTFSPGDAGELAALLARPEELTALVQPEVVEAYGAETASAELAADYARALRGECAPLPALEPIGDEERIELLWRRAERRFWTALQQPNPQAPP
jgi:glycosyltransferase involved in cell wall biosynthesis